MVKKIGCRTTPIQVCGRTGHIPVKGSQEIFMSTESLDLTFLTRQQEKILSELNAIRQESRQVRTGFSTVSEYLSRLNKRLDDLERRIIDMREDTEAMIKLEIGGAVANLETRLEQRVDEQFDRFYRLLDDRLPHKNDPQP